jgi:hypothetical protein
VCLCVCVWSRVEFVSSVGRPPPQRAVALNSGRIFDFPSVFVCGLSGVGRSVLVSCVCGLFPYLIGNDILIVIETHQLIRKIPSIGGNLQSITIAQLLLLLRWRICFVIFFNHPIRRRVFLFFFLFAVSSRVPRSFQELTDPGQEMVKSPKSPSTLFFPPCFFLRFR